MSFKPTSVPTKRLSETLDSTSYSMKVNNILGWDGADLTAADFGMVHYAVLRDSASSIMELITIDPSTIAAASITILKRGLGFQGDTVTEIAANKLTWVKGQTIVELGAATPQLFQAVVDYINGIAIAGAPNATTTLQGLVELATQAEVDAGTGTGGTGASLVATPALLRAKKFHDYLVDASGTDSYAITPSPAITAYGSGQLFVFKAGTSNTGTASLNVSALGAKTIVRSDGTALETGDIIAGQIVIVVYDAVTGFMQLQHRNELPPGIFGTGSDGAVTLDGSTAYAGFSTGPSANVYTLTRDVQSTTFVINTGVTLNTAGYRIFATVSISGAGTIQNNGNNGSNGSNGASSTNGAAGAGGTVTTGYFSNVAGSAGGSGNKTNGVAGTSSTSGLGSTGATGGNGGDNGAAGGASSGGAGGTNSVGSAFGTMRWRTIDMLDVVVAGIVKLVPQGGAGSGGSGGNNGGTSGSGAGGGGGASGGFVFISARLWAGTFVIKALGGTGGNGGSAFAGNAAAGGGGGGAGGNGGTSVVVYGAKTWTGSYTLTGGTGGTGTAGSGSPQATNGATGTTGTSYEVSAWALA